MSTLQERRSAETRQAILDSAYRVFAQKGYAQATVDDIAATCGTSKGAVYHHFDSKEALFRTLLTGHHHELEAMATAVGQARSFRELIAGVAAVWIDHYHSDPLFLPLALEMRVHATRAAWARTLVGDFYRRLRTLIAGLLRAARTAGLVRRDLDVDAAAILLFGVLDGACLQAALDPDHVDLNTVRESLTDLIERFLGASTRKGGMVRLRASLLEVLQGAAVAEPVPPPRRRVRARNGRAGRER